MKTLLYILVLFCSTSLLAQNGYYFSDPTAQWSVMSTTKGGIQPPGQISTAVYHANSDTVINGQSYQNISHNYLRRDSLNRIYAFNVTDSNEILLYDFSKQAGDSIPDLGIVGLQSFCLVDSVDYVFIGHSRKRMYVRIGYNMTDLPYSDVWVDGIGSLYNIFLYPFSTWEIPENPDDTLLCYSENGQQLYQYSGYDTCFIELSVGVSEIRNPQSAISPNPATTHVTITIPETLLNTTATITDITGRRVGAVQLTTTNLQLATADWSNGVYFITLTNSQGTSATKKLVVGR